MLSSLKMTDPNRPVTGYPAPNPNGNPPPPPPLSYASVPPPAYYNNHQYNNYNNNNPTNYYPDPYAPQRATFLRRILGFMIAAVIITGTVLFIIWLILRPRLPEFRVDSLTVSNLNLSSSPSVITRTFYVGFTVQNPNKKITLTYDDIGAEIYYNRYYITQNTLAPFRQGTKNETTLRAVFSPFMAYVDSRVVDGLSSARSKGGNVGFNVRMYIRIGFKSGVWRAKNRILKVFCGELSAAIASNATNGTMIGGPQQCKVGL